MPAIARRTTLLAVPLEVIAVAAIAIFYAWREPMLPAVVPLFVVATISRYLRGKTWDDTVRGGKYVGLAALAGLAALVVALAVGSPIVELSGHGVEWSQYPVVRGSPHQLFAVAILVAISAVAAELALRGWIVARALELGAMPWLAVAIGALAEAAIWPGGVGARAGAALTGAGLGVLYVAAGRTTGAPIAARVMFQLGALVLEGLRLVG